MGGCGLDPIHCAGLSSVYCTWFGHEPIVQHFHECTDFSHNYEYALREDNKIVHYVVN